LAVRVFGSKEKQSGRKLGQLISSHLEARRSKGDALEAVLTELLVRLEMENG
jgi:hypothetical protein